MTHSVRCSLPTAQTCSNHYYVDVCL
uniref:Uncharacterized protein n=1 Tax=Ciona intestinalis TaxID=7719 RepID=H2XK97_CIOIN